MNFFKTFLATLLAIVVTHFVAMIFFAMVIAGILVSNSERSQPLVANSILMIDLSSPISDSPTKSSDIFLDFEGMFSQRTPTLLDVVMAIDYATIDDNIKGIYINVQSDQTPIANLEDIRSAIARFRESGKFVVSYNSIYSQSGYYLSSVADRVYMNPEGVFEWQGISSVVMFYKGLIDKLGIEVDVIRYGSFKAAVEPFLVDKMSPESRLQTEALINSMWGVVVGDISLSRSIDTEHLNTLASDLSIISSEDALKHGMIDGLLYQDEVFGLLDELVNGGSYDNYEPQNHEIVSLAKEQQPNLISLTSYVGHMDSNKSRTNTTNKIAVVYVDGEIVDGRDDVGMVGDISLTSSLARARMDKDVKGVVLRVNSPGGSGIASESIWRAIEVLHSEKPVVVSMGKMAASGGYYISCGVDAIFANRTTLTGSIGVFSLSLNVDKGLKEKLGITIDVAKTNPSADLGTPFRRITQHERDVMQCSVDQFYKTFVNHVSTGRNMTFDGVDSVAQGRVWSGADGQKMGLIDSLGGLKDAIEYMAVKAGVEGDYKVVTISESTDMFASILNAVNEVSQSKTRSELGDAFIHYSAIQNMLKQNGKVQARIPYVIDIK